MAMPFKFRSCCISYEDPVGFEQMGLCCLIRKIFSNAWKNSENEKLKSEYISKHSWLKTSSFAYISVI